MMRRGIGRATICVFLAGLPSGVSAQVEWKLSESPTIVVGGLSERGAGLHRVPDAMLLANGDLVVLNSGTDELLVFDGEGDLKRRIGGEGKGPGEFTGARIMSPDFEGGLWVYDPTNVRVTQFDSLWEVVETRRVGFEIAAVTPVPNRAAPFTDGRLPLVKSSTSMRQNFSRANGLHRDSIILSVHDGVGMTELGRFPRGRVFKVGAQNRFLTQPVPFDEKMLIGTGPSSIALLRSHGTRVSVVDRSGLEIHSVEARGSRRRVTADDWAAFEARFRTERGEGVTIGGTRTDPGPTVERFLETTPRGDDYPLFDEVRVDRSGAIWVREYSLGSDVNWQVLRPDVGLLGSLTLDASWDLLDQSESAVVVRIVDVLGVEEVRVYELQR